MLGESGTEQFTIVTRVDGKIVGEQAIHDPFLHNKTVILVSRWDMFKALFHGQYKITVEVSVRGTEGVQRAIMTLDPEALARETAIMLADRKRSREASAGENNCFGAGQP